MKDDNYEKLCFCTLNRNFGFEPIIARRLVDHYGTASALFNMSNEEISRILGPFSKYSQTFSQEQLKTSEKELALLEKSGRAFITLHDKSYPSLLKECDDAPLGLYIRSSSVPDDIFNSSPCIAIVGTRDLSLYGKEWCGRIVSALSTAKTKPVIVSGLALGVDITAHTAALENGLKTIGVMATGIDDVYPARHREFARVMAESPGCALITDYPKKTSPVAINFLRRNRIIAGMCTATVLVESKDKGGGMLTANLASSYNRDVYALPGRIDDLRSQGCNRLIRAKIAEPLSDLEDFVDSTGLGVYERRSRKSLDSEIVDRYGNMMDEKMLEDIRNIAGLIKKYRGATIEDLCSSSGMRYKDVAALTGILEKDMFIDIDLLQRCTINVKKA